MDATITSAAVVALAETGDKTQILSMVLAGRWRRPGPILLGILVATLANHLPAALIGVEIASAFSPEIFRRVTAASFLVMAVWILIPDRPDADDDRPPRGGVFVATVIAFFLAEMGDKTQLATVALGSRFGDVAGVTAGTNDRHDAGERAGGAPRRRPDAPSRRTLRAAAHRRRLRRPRRRDARLRRRRA